MFPETPALPSVAPTPLIGLAPLMRMALSGCDLHPLAAQLLERAQQDPHDAHALLDLSVVLQLSGNRELGLAMQAQALVMQQLYHQPVAGGKTALRLLVIKGPGDLMANTPVECLLEGSEIALHTLYIAPGLPFPESLPDHDLAFVAIGESDQNQPLLDDIGSLPSFWPRPVINHPDQICRLSRDGVYARLHGAPGITMPATIRTDRPVLEAIARNERRLADVLPGVDFPVIVRPIGSHAGQSLSKLDNLDALAGYLRQVPQEQFYVAPFIDYRSSDGQFRKYRIALIGGQPYVCHLAISDHWMIHYLNAGMADSAAKRAEEAQLMETFDSTFACRHAEAFQAIAERMQLDYLGIDCGETADGKLLIFEVDSSMIVHAMDPVDLFPYKQPQMQKVFAVFRAFLMQAADRSAA